MKYKHYQQLNKEERFYIWNALRSGQTQQEVAVTLGRHPSTISREIKPMLPINIEAEKVNIKLSCFCFVENTKDWCYFT